MNSFESDQVKKVIEFNHKHVTAKIDRCENNIEAIIMTGKIELDIIKENEEQIKKLQKAVVALNDNNLKLANKITDLQI